MATRRYEQRLRAEASAETRRRILDAVYEALRATPISPISLDKVARTAGVARSTVYLVFGSRGGLFLALVHDLAERTGLDRLVEAVAHPDAGEHLRQGIRAGVAMFAADPAVYRALQAMAQLDPDSLGPALAAREEARAGGMAHLARRLAKQGVLRPDVTVDEAADVLWVLTSFESYDLLSRGRKRSADDVVDRLVTTAERSLCR
jgi:AcrR family transcriptional regulator